MEYSTLYNIYKYNVVVRHITRIINTNLVPYTEHSVPNGAVFSDNDAIGTNFFASGRLSYKQNVMTRTII